MIYEFNAHEMSTIRHAIDRVARDEVGPDVQQARLLRERLGKTIIIAKGLTLTGALHSQEAYEKLIAHAHHGFKHGHFTGSFTLDGGTYSFETYSQRVVEKEDYHNGHFYKMVPRIKYTFTISHGGWMGETDVD